MSDSLEKTINKETPIALDMQEFAQIMWRDINRHLNENSTKGIKYTKEQLRRFLENPQSYERQLREVSMYFVNTSSHYMRLVNYLSTMLTLDYLVVPINIENVDLSQRGFSDNYNRVVNYMENFNVKHELGKVLKIVIAEDVFFGYERKKGNSFTIQRLPSNYCKITGVEDGTFTFSFNMQYFDNADDIKFNLYPEEFKILYDNYVRTSQRWQEVSGSNSVCFKFREDINYSIPIFTSIFEEILDLVEIKDLKKTKLKLENFKLLVQKIPFKKEPKTEKDFLISLDTVKTFHKNIKATLPEQVGLISTPMDITDYSFERKKGTDVNSMAEAEQEFYNASGVTQGIFNGGTKSSATADKSIKVDESFMFSMLRQFERFFNKRVNSLTSSTYSFKVMLPDLTIYNRDDMLEKYLKMAEFGYPKTLVACALGLTPSKLVGLIKLESDYFNLQEKMIPLQSSHVQSTENDGSNKKDDKDLSDKGRETRDRKDNENKK